MPVIRGGDRDEEMTEDGSKVRFTPSPMYAWERAGVRAIGVVALATMSFTGTSTWSLKRPHAQKAPHPNPLPCVHGRGNKMLTSPAPTRSPCQHSGNSPAPSG